MNTIHPKQLRALHQMLELAEHLRADMTGVPLASFEEKLSDAKSALEMVHIQQVYLKKENDAISENTVERVKRKDADLASKQPAIASGKQSG